MSNVINLGFYRKTHMNTPKLPSVLILSPTYESAYGPARDAPVNFAGEYAEAGGKVRIRSIWRSSNIGEARTMLALNAMASDFDVVLWIDSDNVYSPTQATAIVRQAYEKKTVVGALYRTRTEALKLVCEPVEPLNLEEGPQGLTPAYWVGFGLTAMPISVLVASFERFGKGGMFRTVDPAEVGTIIPPHADNPFGEDVAFCRHWQMMGHTVYVDTATRIGHIGPTIFNL